MKNFLRAFLYCIAFVGFPFFYYSCNDNNNINNKNDNDPGFSDNIISCYLEDIKEYSNKKKHKRVLTFTFRLKNEGKNDLFLPIHTDMYEDTIYKSKLELLIDNKEVRCIVYLERKNVLSIVPAVSFLCEYENNNIARKKIIRKGDFHRKMYSGDELVFFIEVERKQLAEEGIDENIDIDEISKYLELKYKPCLIDTVFDDRPISRIRLIKNESTLKGRAE